jgi:hypothetical protein
MTKSHASHCLAENIGIAAVVVAELKFRDVERHVFLADLVERADDATFEDAPEALNRVCVNGTDNVLVGAVVDRDVGIFACEVTITACVIGAKQTDFVRHGFVHKSFERGNVDIIDHASNHVALTPYSADHDGFAGRQPASAAIWIAVFPMLVVPLAADECFVHFDDTTQLLDILDKRDADFVAHAPSGFVGTEAHVAHDLQCTHSLFAGEHQVGDAEPIAERLIRVLEDRAGDVGEPVAGLRRALVALPGPGAIRQLVRIDCTTARAVDTFGPAAPYEVSAASFLIGKHPLEFRDAHLVHGLGVFARHRNISNG